LRLIYIVIFCFCIGSASSQTLGGDAAYNFLKLPQSVWLTATGGANVSYRTDDVAFSINNPALLTRNLHSQAGFTFNSFFAGINAYQLSGGYHLNKLNTTLAAGLFYIDYGNISQRDAAGFEEGIFKPRDYVFQLSMGKKYLEKWQYGLSAKYIHSDYGSYASKALAFDVGILFYDTTALFSAGVLAKNIGGQLSNYVDEKEELPFEMQVGITKKLENAPLGFSVTAQHAHRFGIGTADSIFNDAGTRPANNSFFNKFFNHLVLASHVYIGESLEFSLAYNRLRRNELNIGNSGNGLNGISAGFQAKFKKLNVQYSRAYYQRGTAYNQFGINVRMNQLFNMLD